MSLRAYHKKRDFKKTPEPYGKKKPTRLHNSYLIQKHAASHLHYDLRLELNGTLKSWAVPKGPSLDPSVKRLAVHVEDHPLEYGKFQGIIPKNQYGGGTVMMWDKGTWESQNDNPQKAYSQGNMTFALKGKKLKGLWKLIRIKTDPKNWLLIKIKDGDAKAEKQFDVTKKLPLSVTTQESMDEIAEKTPAIWSSKKEKETKKPAARLKKKPEILTRLKKTKLPSLIKPQLAVLVATPPKGANWLHEVKWDGYRILTFVNEGSIRLLTRRLQDWTHKFPHLVAAIKKLKINNSILDGEIIIFNKEKLPDFQLLQNAMKDKQDKKICYYLFDVLYLAGKNLMTLPLLERKKLLLATLTQHKTPALQYNDHVLGSGDNVFKNACKLGLEGIVSKDIHSVYQQKRVRSWQKIKCTRRQEFVIGGYSNPAGKRQFFGALLLGVYKNNKFIYCGRVGTGFNTASLKSIGNLLAKHTTKQMPFQQRPPEAKEVTWVKPVFVIEIEFTEWTHEGILRHPSFKGLRQDKAAKKITREKIKLVKEPRNGK